jgi:hypothetical protein
MKEQVLYKVKNGVFENKETKEIYLIKASDRPIKNIVYYIQKIQNSKALYISALFKTKQDYIFTFDIIDNLGIKKYYTAEIKQDKIIIKYK